MLWHHISYGSILVIAKVVFDKFDEDGSGQMDLEEMKLALKALGFASSMNARMEVFKTIDVDGSGTLDFEEFLMLLKVDN